MSSYSRPSTKQKQSSHSYRLIYSPISLPEPFPIVGGSFSAQGDTPITFLHAHDSLELGYCFEGAGIFVIGKKVLPFQKGDISVIPPSEFHLARSMAGTQSTWAWLYFTPLRLLRASPTEVDFLGCDYMVGKDFPNIVSPRLDNSVGPLLRQIFQELNERRCGYQIATRGLVQGLMVRLKRLGPTKSQGTRTAITHSIHRVAPALDLMAARYTDRLTIKDWARPCHLSTTHFRRLFRRSLGQSPHLYLTELRVRMAASRLHATEDKVLVIAENVGFPTLSSFNRAFRKLMKMTPRQWRTKR